MNSISLVIQREYLTRVRKKSFIILTLLMPVLMVLMTFVPIWLSSINDNDVKRVAVIDNTGLYANLLQSTERYQFEVIDDNSSAKAESQIGSELFGIVQITDDLSKKPDAISITSEKQTPEELQRIIRNAIEEKVMQQKLDQLTSSSNVDSDAVAQVRKIIEGGTSVNLKTYRMSSDGDITESSTEMASVIGMIFTFLIYMFILLYGNMVMQGVLEEKKSRIVEVMVSSIKPVNLLIGKIVGIGLVGITQLAIWGILISILMGGASALLSSPEQMANLSMDINPADLNEIMSPLRSINWIELFIFFMLFFIGGYVLYASIFAMFASAVDSEEDTSQFLTPVTLLIMFAFFAGIYSVSNPDGPLAFWCSLIPFTSPIVMMMRLPFGIPLWEKLLSVALLYGTFVGIAILAAKIYRVGILMYGKKPSVKEMFKWVRYK